MLIRQTCWVLFCTENCNVARCNSIFSNFHSNILVKLCYILWVHILSHYWWIFLMNLDIFNKMNMNFHLFLVSFNGINNQFERSDIVKEYISSNLFFLLHKASCANVHVNGRSKRKNKHLVAWYKYSYSSSGLPIF